MNYQIDVFFEGTKTGAAEHFERTWGAVPLVGDTVAVIKRDERTGEESTFVGDVNRRIFLSETPEILRVQLVVTLTETEEPEAEPDTL